MAGRWLHAPSVGFWRRREHAPAANKVSIQLPFEPLSKFLFIVSFRFRLNRLAPLNIHRLEF
jgi:hypothetical protein